MADGTGSKFDDKPYLEIFQTVLKNVSNFATEMREHGGVDQPPAAEGQNGKEEREEDLVNFDLDQFWAELYKSSSKLGFECNKICLMWMKPPFPTPKDMITVCGTFELACVAVLSSYYKLPPAVGSGLRNRLRHYIVDLLENCVKFTQTLIRTTGLEIEESSHPLLADCGLVMQHCDHIQALPKNNSEVCVERLLSEAGMIKDALRELEEAKNSDSFIEDEFEESWTDKDLKIMNPLLGIMKTSGALIKKTCDTIKKFGSVKRRSETAEYDRIVDKFAMVPPIVDDLALSLYPPLDWSESKSIAWNLKSHLEEIMTFLGDVHFMQMEDNKKWLDFVRKAVVHNASEIQRIFIEHGLAELSLGSDTSPEKVAPS